jgi:hypothetical protein
MVIKELPKAMHNARLTGLPDISLYEKIFLGCIHGESIKVLDMFKIIEQDDTLPTPHQPLAVLVAMNGQGRILEHCIQTGASFDSNFDWAAAVGANDATMLDVLYSANWKDMQNSQAPFNKLMPLALKKGRNTLDWLLEHGGQIELGQLQGSARGDVNVKNLARVVEICGGISVLERSGAIQESARVGDLEKLKYLVEGGLDVNQVMKFTALYLAIESEQLDTVKYLLEHGALVAIMGAADGQEETHLQLARKIGNIAILELIEAKAQQEGVL